MNGSGNPAAPVAGIAISETYINVLTVFISIALYNVLELTAWILGTFKRWSGLYFWSLLIASWGVAFNAVGYLLLHRDLVNNGYLVSTLILVGWAAMVNGQSVVLYSRLHLVLRDSRRMRAILCMIIFNAVTMVIPVVVLVYGASANPARFQRPYDVYEKIQLSVFFVQEAIISAVYVWETIKLMRIEQHVRDKAKLRRLMKRLIYVNVAIIMLDITIPALEFSDNFLLQTSYKPLAYSIKLKLEFSVLSQLVSLARRGSRNGSFVEQGDIVLDSTITPPGDTTRDTTRRTHSDQSQTLQQQNSRQSRHFQHSVFQARQFRHGSTSIAETPLPLTAVARTPRNGSAQTEDSLIKPDKSDLFLRKAKTLTFGDPSVPWGTSPRGRHK